ncbi:MAG: chemotaxis protein CheA, partial [Acidobacteriota bacterium]
GTMRSGRIELVPETSEDSKEPETSTGPKAPKAKSPSKRRKKKEPPVVVDVSPEKPGDDCDGAGDIDTGGDQEIEAPTTSSLGESSLRVDVHVLDHLMNLVGELVLARNQILRLSEGTDDRQFELASTRLHGVTTDLQEAVMRTRMQPISLLWKKLPRFVRDLSRQFDKKVDIKMEGQDTELDKAVIEAIQGSLLHLVRNSLDHGIEKPDLRRERGKSPTGTLRLKAHHEGGNVLIEVSDDGGGIDHEAVLKRGLEAGLVSGAEAGSLDPKQIRGLIFQPGFSTARRVTNVSGRGVGLDIVRNNIEAIGGSVEIHSDPGQSTSFRLKIPLTLAIIPVLLVAVRGQRFAIPQLSVVELVRFDDESGGLGIEDLNGVPVYRLRGHLLPLLYLDEELGFADSREPGDGAVNIVVLQGDDRRFGLIVDSIEDSQEIVVKPLGRLIEALPYAGSTILGEGAVALILDVLRLGLKAGVVSEARTHQAAPDEDPAIAETGERKTLLYLMGPADERMAVDFSAVDRLEFIPTSKIESVADLPVVQYRDEILQLVWVDQTLPERRDKVRKITDDPDLDALQVVVCTVDGLRIGLIVYRILDIIDQSMNVTRPASREGIEKCVVVEERVTEIIDLRTLIRLSDPGFFERGLKPSAGGG